MDRIIRVCMGSACHVKGAPTLATAFQEEINARGLSDQIQLMGRFCQKQCSEGLNVEVNGATYNHVKLEDVPRLIDIAMGVE